LGCDQAEGIRREFEIPAAFFAESYGNKILARTIESPLDLERMNPHNWHGSCHAGGSGPAQSGAMRPMPGYAQHRHAYSGFVSNRSDYTSGWFSDWRAGQECGGGNVEGFWTSIEEVVKA